MRMFKNIVMQIEFIVHNDEEVMIFQQLTHTTPCQGHNPETKSIREGK